MRSVPLSERQLAGFAEKHAWQIPFDTSPRHLAGPGDARHVTHGLAAAGWSAVSDPLSAEIVLRSPDLRHSLQFDPQSTTSAWWRLRAEPTDTEPGWYAEFGELVPAEVLAGFTDALITPPPQQSDPWQPLTSAGWHRDSDGTAQSPDSMCHIELRPLSEFSGRSSWHVETCEPADGQFPGPRIWHAYFDEDAPAHLVGSFLTALADRSPLQRACTTAPATTAPCRSPARCAHSRWSTPTPPVSSRSVPGHAPPCGSRRNPHRPRRRPTPPSRPPAAEPTGSSPFPPITAPTAPSSATSTPT